MSLAGSPGKSTRASEESSGTLCTYMTCGNEPIITRPDAPLNAAAKISAGKLRLEEIKGGVVPLIGGQLETPQVPNFHRRTPDVSRAPAESEGSRK